MPATTSEHVTALLADRVPLRLLFDLAGFAPSSEELLREERFADADVRDLAELAVLAARVDAAGQARSAWSA